MSKPLNNVVAVQCKCFSYRHEPSNELRHAWNDVELVFYPDRNVTLCRIASLGFGNTCNTVTCPFNGDVEETEMSKEVINKASAVLKELGALIEGAETGAEADEIYTMILAKLGGKIADKIWDDLVDWKKVTWYES